jgi:hypothetical protein
MIAYGPGEAPRPTLIPPDSPADGLKPPIEQNQVLGFSIKQRQSFELALESLKTLAGKGSEFFESREYLETTIYTLKMQQDTGTIAYAITDDFFFLSFGSTEALESILVSMSARGKNVWDQPRVHRALAGLPDGAAGIHYQDMAAMGQAILELLRSAAALSPDTESQPGDFGEIPDSDTIGKYLGPAVTGVYKDDSSLVMRTRLLAAEGRVE